MQSNLHKLQRGADDPIENQNNSKEFSNDHLDVETIQYGHKQLQRDTK